jgi:DNA-binding transcriptional MerR regulator
MSETMTIGELARRASVNPRTLRYYERIGLLAPSARSAAGYRLYTERDAGRLAFIRQAQALGLSLGEIADIIALREAGSVPCWHVRSLAQAKVATIDTRLAELRALREELVALAQRAQAAEEVCAGDAAICHAIEGGLPRPS